MWILEKFRHQKFDASQIILNEVGVSTTTVDHAIKAINLVLKDVRDPKISRVKFGTTYREEYGDYDKSPNTDNYAADYNVETGQMTFFTHSTGYRNFKNIFRTEEVAGLVIASHEAKHVKHNRNGKLGGKYHSCTISSD